MPHAGQVFIIPPSRDPAGDPKHRPHVLLRDCHADSSAATLAFASTQMTEAHCGAPNILINPAATSYTGTGFTQPSYLYTSRLVGVDPDDLHDPAGRLIDEMPAVRASLRRALGLGTGSCAGTGSAAGSLRGRVVHLGHGLEEELGAALAVILTEPTYSKKERFQVVVPILAEADFEVEGSDVVIEPSTTRWLAQVDAKYTRAFLWTAAIFSVFHPSELRGISPLCLDEGTMRDIDRALAVHFHL